ncbi:MAG: DUF6391 domain-containing protein [Chloroflexota bacterium]
MIESIAKIMEPVLELPVVRRTRRNHALEHATVHVLAGRIKGLRVAGRSSDGGYVLVGDVPLKAVEAAAAEALQRMQNGEDRLAIHPNCGTNLVTAGVLTTMAGLVGMGTGSERRLTADRISWTMVMMMFAVLFSQPLGMKLQKYITTKGDPGDLEIVSVRRREVKWPFSRQPVVMHTVMTRRG